MLRLANHRSKPSGPIGGRLLKNSNVTLRLHGFCAPQRVKKQDGGIALANGAACSREGYRNPIDNHGIAAMISSEMTSAPI
jgi:hypothetical protein